MNHSKLLFEEANNYIPGGVNSPVRAFKGVGGTPVFFESAKGAYMYDVDGSKYIDYVCSWGAMIAGHGHPEVMSKLHHQIDLAVGFGAPTRVEVQMAKTLCELIPSMEMVRMVNSGTEATMSAIRLARGFTGRDIIIKFDGCYHGHSDSLLVKAGSGAMTLGIPDSLGVPDDIAKYTITLPYNDIDAVSCVFKEYGSQIAGIIVEPVAGNMSCILPTNGFLEELRMNCDRYGAILIFDEVMTGFRVGKSGAQALYDVKPDLTTLGKVIGGGMPVGALGGRRDIMEFLAPVGGVYQAGTLSGNPVAMTAGLSVLGIITLDQFYENITKQLSRFLVGLEDLARHYHVPFATSQAGAMFGLFFTDKSGGELRNIEDVSCCNKDHYAQFFYGMLSRGVYLAPSSFETGFISLAHDEYVIDAALASADKAFSKIV